MRTLNPRCGANRERANASANPCPEQNPVDHLWRESKQLIAANRQFQRTDEKRSLSERWCHELSEHHAVRMTDNLARGFCLKALR